MMAEQSSQLPALPVDDDTTTSNSNNLQAFCVLALYHFVSKKLQDEEVTALKDEVEAFLRRFHSCRGTILLATEGINGTICFPNEHQTTIYNFFLQKFPHLQQTRISYHDQNVFFRLKVRIKNEIVTMMGGHNNTNDNNNKLPSGVTVDPTQTVGTYVPAPEWDRLIQDPTCLVIDTRNEYEYQVGTFRRAVNPHTQSFCEFPQWLLEQQLQLKQQSNNNDNKDEDQQQHCFPKYNKVAMFCTGGIRCEKATSYCLNVLSKQQSNLKDTPVYHLKGGILAYLDQVPAEQSTFEGECYVFDQRTAVQHGLRPSETYTLCHACRQPLTPTDREHPDYVEGICCHVCCHDEDRVGRRKRYKERQKQFELCSNEGIPHVHDAKEYKKTAVKGQ